MSIQINDTIIEKGHPVYFIADIAANHGGSLDKAKELIYACSESKVDAVKMQNFSADTIVSDYGFKDLTGVKTHQSNWKESVFDSYKAASIPFEWTLELKELSEGLGMAYFTSPYSLELVRAVAPYVSAFKLGSGDITWHEEIELMTEFGKPLVMATGASDLFEVKKAMEVALRKTTNILLMQCNTNYTAKHGEPEEITRERFSNLNLKVLETYNKLWPEIPLGLSDHTHGSLSVLTAVGLFNCSAVEKHFTLDSSLEGQDHAFSMMPSEWLKMVQETEIVRNEIGSNASFEERLAIVKKNVDRPEYVELMLGSGKKKVEENEQNTVVVQRRAIRAKRTLLKGTRVTKDDLIVLRPCPKDALPPYEYTSVVGRILEEEIQEGDYFKI
jgi:sialic acid synthase SpsE